VKLTEREKKLVARRAHGEYAVNDPVERIWRAHRKKNRNPEDAPYLEFMRVVHKKNHTWDEYAEVMKPLLDLHPYPWGPIGQPEVKPVLEPVYDGVPEKKPKKRKRRRRTPEQVIQEAEIAPPSPPKKKRRRRRKAPREAKTDAPEAPEEPSEGKDGMVMDDDGFMWLPPGWEPLEE
jgi:hypothetical protein